MSLVSALTTAILPVLSIAAVGFLLGRVRDVEVDPLATITIYVLTPALIFDSLATSTLGSGAVVDLTIGVVAFTLGMAALAEGVGRLLGEAGALRSALVLASAFPNAGNYGIPLAAFAFGAVGRSTAVLYIAVQSVLTYTLGVYLASRDGAGSSMAAVGEVFKLPLVYAVAAAGLARLLGVVPPAGSASMETVALVGNAAIPVMLLMLGVQLANTSSGATVARVGTATVLKLGVSPVLAAGIAIAVGFADATVARVFVLACAMPAAITPLMLVIEFGGDEAGAAVTAPEYVSTAIMVTTLLSVPVLTLVIAVLESGVVV